MELEKYLFVWKKSLIFSLQRYIYDNLRYKYGYFVHRKTFFDDIILINDSYFHFVWRYFFIQDKDINDEELKVVQKDDMNTLFMENYIKTMLLNNSETIYNTKMVEQYGKVYNPFHLIYNNKQSLTEFIYLTPFNLSDKTIEQYRKIFIQNIDVINDLFQKVQTDSKIKNINLYDVGIISYINTNDILFKFLKESCPYSKLDFNSFKIMLWNLINQQVFSIDNLEKLSLNQRVMDILKIGD